MCHESSYLISHSHSAMTAIIESKFPILRKSPASCYRWIDAVLSLILCHSCIVDARHDTGRYGILIVRFWTYLASIRGSFEPTGCMAGLYGRVTTFRGSPLSSWLRARCWEGSREDRGKYIGPTFVLVDDVSLP
jgi:hypothetical protein